MGPKTRREREREALRQVILDAARELFVDEGFENVSMRRIAEKIEYSPTTIYLYFEDKLSLLRAICEETFARLEKRMETIRKESDNPVDALKKGVRAYIEFGLKHPNHYKLTFIAQYYNPKEKDPNWEKEHSMGMKAYEHLRSAVEACIEHKIFRETDVDALSQMFWAAGHGVTSLLITKKNFPFVNKNVLIDMTLDTLVEGLKQ
jgi:AcrR family transcriptional regulator